MGGSAPSAPWLVYPGSPPHRARGGHHVLLHPRLPRWVVLNDTALAIARALLGGEPVERAAAGLAASFRVPAERARRDVAGVLERLRRERFLEPEAGAPPERSPEIRSLFLHLTGRCNLSCPHCYAIAPAERAAPADLPAPAVLSLIDELADLGGRRLTLSGGEPLLYPELRAVLARAAARGLDIGLLTNGTLLDEGWARLLADLPVSVQVSLDGSRAQIHDAVRGRGSFERALRAVDLLQKAGLGGRVNLCATVMQANVRDLPEIVRLGERLGVPLVRFLPLRRKGAALETWDAVGAGVGTELQEGFYRFAAGRRPGGATAMAVSCGLSGFVLRLPPDAPADEIWCPVGRKLDVDVAGDAYPCVLLMEERFRVGNVLRDGLAPLAASAVLRSACRDLCERRTAIERCAACLWRNLCQAGCMGQALDHAGTTRAVDDFCGYRQRAYEEAFDRILAQEAGGDG